MPSEASGTLATPLKLAIAALGGQGGGVLTDWLIDVAESEQYLVQSTSVPGVAQRTGATIYYLEFFPRAAVAGTGRDPVMALMPASGDVDCVVAAELAEAGRATQRGLVTPERTVLITSTHRSYTIAERSALGDGIGDAAGLMQTVRESAARCIAFDMQALAEEHDSVISAVLLGAIAGASVLPFSRQSFESAIRHSRIAVETNLAAFAAAFQRAARQDSEAPRPQRSTLDSVIPVRARSVAGQALLDDVRSFPAELQSLLLTAVRRLVDYQDPAYARLYLDRIRHLMAQPGADDALIRETSRGLALWMSFEDTVRVADLKTRAERLERVQREVDLTPGQLLAISEFLKPRVEEIAGTLPARLGRWIERSPRFYRLISRFTDGKRIRTTTLTGFVLLRLIASLRRWRRGSRRFEVEDARIRAWLRLVESTAARHTSLALEIARMQRLVKGYGDTHERGWRSFSLLAARADALARRRDGAEVMARLHAAALHDEDGAALRQALAALET